MSQYELCNNIRNRLALKAAEICAYTNWSDEFSVNNLRKSQDGILNDKTFKKVDPTKFTKNEMKLLGFCLWSDEKPIMLIPLWLLPYLVDEFEAGCLDQEGTSLVKREEIDNDHRYGCLAYGVIPSDHVETTL